MGIDAEKFRQSQELLNSEWLPEDAGEYADGLLKIIRRIPDNWGRWIGCNRGWYRLLVELDEKLAQIEPDYEVHQVKEKFGTLRYYVGLPDLQPYCCINIEATRTVDGPVNPRYLRMGEERTIHEQYALDKWYYEVFMPHFDTDEHEVAEEALEPEREKRRAKSEQMYEIINEYEKKSAITCELCGDAGQMKVQRYWYQTLCDACGDERGFENVRKDGEEDER